VMTTFGMIKVMRPLFRSERNGPTRCLVTEKALLVDGMWTEPAAKLAALATTEMPHGQAEAFFREAGIMDPSRSSLLRLVNDLSELWEGDRSAHEVAVREEASIPTNAVTVAFSLDGVMLMIVGSDRQELKAATRAKGLPDKGPAGWREASVGVVCFYDKDGQRIATRRYGRMPEENKSTTKAWLQAEVEHIRRVRPDLVTVALADGAANNWTFFETLELDFELVDFYHTAEHLHRHVSLANGASSADTQAKVRDMRHRLLTEPGAAAAVFADMSSMREKAGTAPASTRKKRGQRQPDYFQRHRERMDYATARANGLPIGSGVTESTCKLSVCDRMRRTGMRWSEVGGQAILTLRTLRVSDQFDIGWGVLMAANARRLAA
jgi:hypothetical protein